MADSVEQVPHVGPQVIFGFDAGGRCTLSIGPGLEMLGTKPHELEGQDLFEVYGDDPSSLDHMRKVLSGETFTVERDYLGRVLSVYYQPLRAQDGTVTGALGVTTDVTEQRRIEGEVQSARERASLLADLSKVLSRDVPDPDSLLRRVVRALTRPLGDVGAVWLCTPDGARLTPRAVWDGVADRLVPLAGREAVPGGEPSTAEVAPSTVPTIGVQRDLDADVGRDYADELLTRGTDVPPRSCLRVPLRSRGQLIGMVDIARSAERGPFSTADVSLTTEVAERCALALDNASLLAAQRTSYEQLVKFQALAEASHDLIAISDSADQLVYANPSLRAAGIDATGDVWAVATAAQVREETQAELRRGQQSGGWAGDVTLGLPAGTMTAHVGVVPLFHPDDGSALGTAWIARDVTGLRRTEAALRTANSDYMQFKALVEGSSDFIGIADLEGRGVYLNPGGRELIGIDPDFDITTTHISEHVSPDRLAEFERSGMPALLTQGHWEGETALRDCRGGPPIPVAVASFLMRDVETDEPFAIGTVQRDITERLASESAVRRLADQRQALLTRLVDAQDDERTRIAADVHDDPVQACAAVELRLGLLARQMAERAPELLGGLEKLQSTVSEATSRLRALLFDLEPPDLGRGLSGALSRAAREIFEGTGVQVEVDGAAEPDVPDATRAVAYRIAKEAMTNARKHASARQVAVTVAGRDGGIEVCVVDDGVGVGSGPIESSPGHRGVSGMQDRALVAGGTCSVVNGVAGGTVVTVWLPGDRGSSTDALEESAPSYRSPAYP